MFLLRSRDTLLVWPRTVVARAGGAKADLHTSLPRVWRPGAHSRPFFCLTVSHICTSSAIDVGYLVQAAFSLFVYMALCERSESRISRLLIM
jgi:hypothetical protein